jgi:hypothetical protein
MLDLLGATKDVEAYVHLGDWVLEYIEGSFDRRFEEAQRIIGRLRARRLYDQVSKRDQTCNT